jgi:hypothetical protein
METSSNYTTVAQSNAMAPVADVVADVAPLAEVAPSLADRIRLYDDPRAGPGWIVVGGGLSVPGYASIASAKTAIRRAPEWKAAGATILPFRYNDGGLTGLSPYADTRTRYAVLIRDIKQPAHDVAPVADVVADVVAQAAATAAIDAARESATLSELTSLADVVPDVPELAEVEEMAQACADLANTASTPRAEHATPQNPGHRGGIGQRITGKSGRWCATFHTTPAGMPGMTYTGRSGNPVHLEFETGSERMRTLQAMARMDDAETPSTENKTRHAPYLPQISKNNPNRFTVELLDKPERMPSGLLLLGTITRSGPIVDPLILHDHLIDRLVMGESGDYYALSTWSVEPLQAEKVHAAISAFQNARISIKPMEQTP